MIQCLQTVFNELLNASSPAKTNSDQRQEISLRPRGKPDPANGQVGREGAYDSYTSHNSLTEGGTMNKSSLGMNECSQGMNKDATGMNKSSLGMNKGVKSKDSHDSYTSHDSLTEGGTMNKSSLGMNENTTATNKSSLGMNECSQGMNKSVKSKDSHNSYTSHDSLTEGGTMNKRSQGMNENTTATNKSSLGMNERSLGMNKGVKSKDSHDSYTSHDSLTEGGTMNKRSQGMNENTTATNKSSLGMNERSQGMNKGVKSKDSHDSYTSHDSLTEGGTMNKRTSTTNKGVKAKNSQDSLANVKSKSKKTGHNGYYIPPVCFKHYYEGRDRNDEPYRKLRWYEAVLPDLMQGMKYADILQKQYKVYDFRQDRYVVKNISDTTLRSTIVAQLKTLENVS
jgi:hypothetical protein